MNHRFVNVRVHRAASAPRGKNPRKPIVQRMPWFTIIICLLFSPPPADVVVGVVEFEAIGKVRSRVNVPLSKCRMSIAPGEASSGGESANAQMTACDDVGATEVMV